MSFKVEQMQAEEAKKHKANVNACVMPAPVTLFGLTASQIQAPVGAAMYAIEAVGVHLGDALATTHIRKSSTTRAKVVASPHR